MTWSYVYTSGNVTVACATLRLANDRYCGNFIALITTSDGRREIHERSCPGSDHTPADALTRARAMAESTYPPTPVPRQNPATGAAARTASAHRLADVPRPQ